MKVLITGGRGGLGRAFADELGDAAAWRALEGEYDAAFLNAGIVTGESSIAALTDEQYARAVRANMDGVVYGVRELASRLMPNGGSIVATSSLAGLTATPMDPIYALTKHAVIGFVRSVASQLAIQGIRINALCPGYTDTAIVPDELRDALDVPLMEPSFVAEAAMRALNDEETGGAWVVQPNRILRFRFPHIPGPR